MHNHDSTLIGLLDKALFQTGYLDQLARIREIASRELGSIDEYNEALYAIEDAASELLSQAERA